MYLTLVLSTGTPAGADGAYYLSYGAAIAGQRPVGIDDLWAGPGYALALGALLRLGGGAEAALLLNAGLLYAAVVLLSEVLVEYLPRGRALVLAGTFGASPVALDNLRFAMSEPLTTLLTVGTLALLLADYTRARAALLAGVLLLLALTKVLFAYVLAAAGLGLAAWALIGLRSGVGRARWRRTWSLALALVGLLPYLAVTHAITGRHWHLANAGGSSLYSMTSPHPGEVGSWIPLNFRAPPSRTQPTHVSDTATARWQRHHASTIAELAVAEDVLARDEVYRRRGWVNLLAHPDAFVRNYISNHGRMWLSWPFSYYVLTWVPFVVGGYHVALLTAVAWARRGRQRMIAYPAAVQLGALLGVYLALSGALSAYPRQLYVVLPWVMVLGVGVGRGSGAPSTAPRSRLPERQTAGAA